MYVQSAPEDAHQQLVAWRPMSQRRSSTRQQQRQHLHEPCCKTTDMAKPSLHLPSGPMSNDLAALQPAHTANMNHPPAHRTQPSSQTVGQQSAGTTTNNKTFKVMRRRRRYTSFLQDLNPSPRRETADRRPQKGAQDLTGAI
ncbi:hypothetical protein BN1708_008205 [Verticillium longisporum]|uniref:Uncharacterized protein n=1 Tax=Verticillium longisporum TaxID=100787 RepID=A0A0G4N283_VERLO|nr:hypothetical protein BN1708_008205 [Verticillium longisporum]